MAKAFARTIEKPLSEINNSYSKILDIYNKTTDIFLNHEKDVNKDIEISKFLSNKYNKFKELFDNLNSCKIYIDKLYIELDRRNKQSRDTFKFYLDNIELVINYGINLIKIKSNIIIEYSIVNKNFLSKYQKLSRKLKYSNNLILESCNYYFDIKSEHFISPKYINFNGVIVDRNIYEQNLINIKNESEFKKQQFYDILDMILAKISFENILAR